MCIVVVSCVVLLVVFMGRNLHWRSAKSLICFLES